ncbi:hypothetical protein SLEP1_g14988 [Rubroshorea leprosula]|uniref:Uncharacterized protein n=1 Tax=Rubroshorea leprosula TaxID=152421 RepID=A0AAV5IWM5_9ROSI|nr:hypothetical protein SLEP1_g14988 [Rubroshorea leprosula]
MSKWRIRKDNEGNWRRNGEKHYHQHAEKGRRNGENCVSSEENKKK